MSTTGPLALHGGTPAISAPTPSMPLRWGSEEKARALQALDQPSLFYWKGAQTADLLTRFRHHYPLEHVMPCSSGTAAIHIAIAAAGIAPGDEVIVPPITDMGTVIGVLYQQGVPVFADLHPHSYHLDPADVRRRITSKTRAIILVHLAGNPTPIEPFRELAREHDLMIIEDCAQSWGTRWNDRPVGTLGDIGCFSLNDFKHIGCGDGGIVGSNHPEIGPRLQFFGDKGYDRVNGISSPSILAPNYRISEPQSAVAAAQMERMEGIAAHRHRLGDLLCEQLRELPGLAPHQCEPGGYSTWWFQMHRLDSSRDRQGYVKALQAEGVPATAGYIPAPLYRYPVFQNHAFFSGRWPIKEFGLTEIDYRETRCPVAEEILSTAIRVPIHQGMDEAWIEGMACAFRKVNAALA